MYTNSKADGQVSCFPLETLNEETPEQRRAAALTVCDHATSVADATLLLQKLGLHDYTATARRWDSRGTLTTTTRPGTL